MKTPPNILVVEDDKRVVTIIADTLTHAGFDVVTAKDGLDGLEKSRRRRPDIVILDVMMPRMDGYQLCRELRGDPATRQIPILMLTAKGQAEDIVKGMNIGADDYLAKPYDNEVLVARVRALLRRTTPYVQPTNGVALLSLSFAHVYQLGVRLTGSVAVNSVNSGFLEMDTEAYARRGDNVPLRDWRFNAKQCGRDLYEKIFASHAQVLGHYNRAQGSTAAGRLELRFEGPREFLRIPLECLFDGGEGGGYLVLRHPLSRSITDVVTQREPVSPSFLNKFQTDQELRILLIGSNTDPAIPGVDEEVAVLERSLKPMFRSRGILAHVDAIPTRKASYDQVREALSGGRYHIVHYAGHGVYDSESPENSHLLFWLKEARKGGLRKMLASELQLLLSQSDVRFIYLSCCVGAMTGPTAQLLDDDFLGISDAIAHSGVPAVIGFRWPVSDQGALALASSFYEGLVEHGRIEPALHDARCRVAGLNRDDTAWLAPVLVLQAQ